MEDNSIKMVATTPRGLPNFDKKGKHAYREWKARVKVHINMSAPAVYEVLMEQEQPNPTLGGNLAKWRRNNVSLYSVFFLAANGGANYYSRTTS